MSLIAGICGGANGCSVGDGIAVVGISLAIAGGFGSIMWLFNRML